MTVLFKYFFLSLMAFCIFIYTVSCNNNTPTPNTPSQQEKNDTLDTNILYIIRENKKQQKRILYVDKNNKTTLLTLMSPETFCLKMKKSDFDNIQKIGLSSDLKEINQLLCSNEQKSKSSNPVPNCDLKSYKITNFYKLEPLNLNNPNTIQLIRRYYEPLCFEFVPW